MLAARFPLILGLIVAPTDVLLEAQTLRTEDGRAHAFEAGFALEGRILLHEGKPCRGAVVTSSAGGRALTDADGRYTLSIDVPADAHRVQVIAVGGHGGAMSASTEVELLAGSGSVDVRALRLAAGACTARWLPTFGGEAGTAPFVRAMVVFDDGDGPALYAAGSFDSAGGQPVGRIARWDGTRWSPLGAGD